MRAFFIVNPNSATVKKNGSILERIADDLDIPIIKTRDTRSLDDVVIAAQEQDANWFCIEGGDGTVRATLSSFMRSRDQFQITPRFSLLPGGMTNQIARQIGLRRPIEARIRELLSRGQPEIHPTPMVQVEVPGETHSYGFLFSSGAIPMATDYYFQKMHSQGKGGGAAVTKMIAKGFAGRRRETIYKASPINLRVTGDKEETHIDADHLTSIVTTLPGLMLGLDPFWAEGKAPLRVTYVGAEARHLFRNLLSVWMGAKAKDRSRDGFESWRANTLKYMYDGPVLLDGDPVSAPQGTVYIRATEPVEFWT